jgi:hypothetical protein
MYPPLSAQSKQETAAVSSGEMLFIGLLMQLKWGAGRFVNATGRIGCIVMQSIGTTAFWAVAEGWFTLRCSARIGDR